MKKLISLVLSAVMVLTVLPAIVTGDAMPFTDVASGAWYFDAVQYVYDRGIMNGQEKTLFAPEKNMTRAELVTVLARLSGDDLTGCKDLSASLTDLDGTEWFASYVGWSVKSEVVKGYDDGSFRADVDVSRQELAILFVRFLDYMGLEIVDENAIEKFADEGDIADWAAKEVEALRVTGLIKGDNGSFRPNSTATRAEIATVASRLVSFIDNRALTLAVDGSFMTAADFNAGLREKLKDDSVSADNYYEIKTAAETLAPGESTAVTVKSGTKEIALTLTKKALDAEALLAENGTEFSYTYKGTLSNDLLAQWLKSMADETDYYDSAEITSPGSGNDRQVTVSFKSGSTSVTRTYTVHLTAGSENTANRQRIFVAPNGSDSAAGTKDAPLATVAGAKAKVRELKRTHNGAVSVFFRGGDYYISETVTFDEADSGTKTAPITYAAYRGEGVNFYGGVKIDPSRITKADKTAADRLLDETAASKLMQIDISGLGIEVLAMPELGGSTFYMNDTPLETSRYPNKNAGDDAYLLGGPLATVTHNDDGSKTFDNFVMPNVQKHLKLWSEESVKNLYMFGYLAYDWTNAIYDASRLDRENNSITLTGAYYFNDIKKMTDKRFFFMNVLEEIDVPGESYNDLQNQKVYFYPSDDFSYDGMFVNTLNGNMLAFNKSENIIVKGINIKYGKKTVVSASGVDGLTFEGCTVAHSTGTAMNLEGYRITVSDCHVYDHTEGGVFVYGGDRVNMISGESVIEYCEIHDVGRTELPYRQCITAGSVGLEVRHNELYNCQHMAMTVYSNDVHITYNDIHDCVQTTADMGAIYYGRDPSILGTVISYNYFHDIGNTIKIARDQHMIYIDDGSMGAEIHGNIFETTVGAGNSVIKSHGAQFLNISGNVFVDVGSALSNYGWSIDYNDANEARWVKFLYERNGDNYGIPTKLLNLNFDGDIWRNHYKGTIWENLYKYIDSERIAEYASLTDDEFTEIALSMNVTATNKLNENVLVNVGRDNGNPYGAFWGSAVTCENNFDADTSIFTSYEDSNFKLTSAGLAKIRQAISGFEDIPFDQMGIVK